MGETSTKIFGYIRVSSKEQNLARQIDSLKQYVPDERDIYADKLSGRDLHRPAYQTLRQMVRTGDTIYIHDVNCFFYFHRFESRDEYNTERSVA